MYIINLDDVKTTFLIDPHFTSSVFGTDKFEIIVTIKSLNTKMTFL